MRQADFYDTLKCEKHKINSKRWERKLIWELISFHTFFMVDGGIRRDDDDDEKEDEDKKRRYGNVFK